MRLKFLFLLLCLPLLTYSQKHEYAIFDFGNPLDLNPSIEPYEGNGQGKTVTYDIFKNKEISISFKEGTLPGGAVINTVINNGNYSYDLRIRSTTTLTFTGSEDASIDSIRFSDDSVIGDLRLASGETGYQDPYQNYAFWYNNSGNKVHEVSFFNNFSVSRIKKIYVYYTAPLEVISPISTDISTDDILTSFGHINLTYSKSMAIRDASNITVSSEDGSIIRNMKATASGNIVRLYLDTPITNDGTYRISVPARSFLSNDGDSESAALAYTVTVVSPKNTLEYESVNPEQGELEALYSGITLAYPSFITVTDKTVVMQKEGEDNVLQDYVPVNISRMTGDSKSVILTFDIPEGITEEGTYTVTIPENTISDQLNGTYNPAFTLTYRVYIPGPEDSETMKAAKALLQKSGVGYPAAGSTSRTALQDLTGSEEIPSDEDLAAAMDAFYNEMEIEMPQDGKYYTIASVNAEGEKLYLAVSDGVALFSTDVTSATAFKATTTAEGETMFETVEGKYFFVSGVTEDESINKLTLNKLFPDRIQESTDIKQLLGLVYVHGSLKNGEGKVLGANAWVSHSSKSFITDVTAEYLHFKAESSSAFLLTETADPTGVPPIEVPYTLTSSVTEGEDAILTLAFKDVDNVVISGASFAYFATSDSERMDMPVEINRADDSGTMFTISVSGLQPGSYQLVLPEGTFTCTDNGQSAKIKTINGKFSILADESENDNEFDYSYEIILLYKFKEINEPIKDVELNDLYVYTYPGLYTGMVADPSKSVDLIFDETGNVVHHGYFEEYEVPGLNGYPALKLVLDEPVETGGIQEGRYTMLVKECTIGDANFGTYLEDENSVKPKDCRVNSEMRFQIVIDNSYATGITNVDGDKTGNTPVIYDLSGRRVQSMSRPGIYIVNGKKVVKK